MSLVTHEQTHLNKNIYVLGYERESEDERSVCLPIVRHSRLSDCLLSVRPPVHSSVRPTPMSAVHSSVFPTVRASVCPTVRPSVVRLTGCHARVLSAIPSVRHPNASPNQPSWLGTEITGTVQFEPAPLRQHAQTTRKSRAGIQKNGVSRDTGSKFMVHGANTSKLLKKKKTATTFPQPTTLQKTVSSLPLRMSTQVSWLAQCDAKQICTHAVDMP